MGNRRITAALITGLLLVSAPVLGACDREDRQDIEEGVNQVEEGAKDVGNEIEKQVDKNIDTDGKDD